MPIGINRSLGGYGAILSFLGIISTVTTLVSYAVYGFTPRTITSLGLLAISSIIGIITFIGFILFFVAMYGFSRDYGEHKLFNYILYGFLWTFIAFIVILAVWFVLVLANVISSAPTLGSTPNVNSLITPYLSPLTVVLSFASLVWLWFNVKAYNLLADKSEIPLFKTGAKLLVAGAILNITIALLFAILAFMGSISFELLALASLPGGILIYAAEAVFAKSFFKIKVPPQQSYATPPVNPELSLNRQSTYCMQCGAPNEKDSVYCIRCGHKLVR